MIRKASYNVVITLLLIAVAVACSAPTSTLNDTQNYEKDRKASIANDSAQRFSADIILTAEENILNEKFIALRKQMKSRYDSMGYFPPSQPFHKYKPHVEQTTLFKLFRNMPKGGIHHLHISAAVDFKWLIEEVIKYPEGYVYWGEPSPEYLKGQIHFFGPDEIPIGFRSASELSKNDPSFKKELLELLTLTHETVADSLDIWAEFQNIFQRLGAFEYKPIFGDYVENIANTLIDDNIMHMESRLFLAPKYDIDASGRTKYFPIDTTLQIIKNFNKNIRKRYPGFTHKAIYTSLRFFSEEKISQELVTAYQLRKKYPEFIKGFDLVAEEDNGHTTRYFKNSWNMRDSLQRVYGVDMPLYLHDGESNSPSIENLYDAVILGSKRIGHGFNLMNFPEVIALVKRNDICIEVSPLSNQILGYVKDLRVHPASLMLRHGVQLSINSDDPSIFGYSGLSYDYWYSTMAWELDLRDIKKLVFNSLTYSSLNAEEKEQALAKLTKSWEQFITYGNGFL